MVKPLDTRLNTLIQQRIDLKTKPLGALGKLEALAVQLVQIFSQGQTQLDIEQLAITRPAMFVFAGDHGIASQGVSIAPSEVTGQMVANFVQGGAAINVFCRQLGWQLTVVDCGTLVPCEPSPNLRSQRLGDITHAFHKQPAMSEMQLKQGLEYGEQVVMPAIEAGSNVIAFGEMGIGNTSSAAAILAALSGASVELCVGRGTGIDDETLCKKRALIKQALEYHQDKLATPEQILQRLGGFEIVQMVGAMLAVARAQKVIIVDGFISTAAAMLASRIAPQSKQYMVFAHGSMEQGHKLMLEQLNAEPLLHLDMRLGEGTGAALALPLLQAALGFFCEMASFADADVTQVVDA
ncbi:MULTISPECIES: nicotinate-nucleotide--dimethylbenzimidazole phosphoribosyltransferase [unclassified Pseudoalteromonas]|uniref:nicotinate-nucleotide--dimethylbenzimidazole phosphoribosyltransferase n=1 Tax=unclassified Pseudoalteromonas TaxID=194690 RepID=UPI001F157D2B|nr:MULTISPECIES: nicotinate-nucleotide--dimethylbenzimidazole phosphoribosyltransferase [unclassified Pseudoalteromonas]MCF2825162.1 nicotinate-nucleotide--dimethylbenzimidazole phosphoribosyltransferase [Pseudoalteromonas sp. OF5H-5]MCF2833161.1 nicotinate-nucleotide--dimethylbenzimidazole phosphoribosyltransferase [Pseudoalteromonas sp. DL2-H6]MCF2925598.1 nicotinate-nucleotide--dimethylbenzimidazole phosphoribosyltransferase [Pseudoalteromonas sp. DL2-H1]